LQIGVPRSAPPSPAQAEAPSRLSRTPFYVAGGLLVLLVLAPVILIRRSRTVGEPIPAGEEPGSDTRVLTPDQAQEDAGPPSPRISEVIIQSCMDVGAKRPADSCDHPVIDDLLRAAAKDSASCMPKGSSGGTLPILVDVSLPKGWAIKKTTAQVTLGRDGRTIKDAKVAQKCVQKLKERIEATGGDAGKHDHARYKLAFAITYPPTPE